MLRVYRYGLRRCKTWLRKLHSYAQKATHCRESLKIEYCANSIQPRAAGNHILSDSRLCVLPRGGTQSNKIECMTMHQVVLMHLRSDLFDACAVKLSCSLAQSFTLSPSSRSGLGKVIIESTITYPLIYCFLTCRLGLTEQSSYSSA